MLKIFKIITFVLLAFTSIFFSNSALSHYENIYSHSFDVYLPYKWNETGLRIAALQNALNIPVTTKYDRATRSAHITYLKALGAPTGNVPAIPVSKNNVTVDANICGGSAARIFAHQILDPHNIPIPSIVVISNISRSGYGPGGAGILMPPCESQSGLAHEFGHYVYDKAFEFNWEDVKIDAAKNFTSVNWIKSLELSPGIERSAHCIGNVLWGYGTYTKCPDSMMQKYAIGIVARAGN